MNTAARIQAAAPVDGILVGAATHRATDADDRLPASASRCEAKGKAEPVEVWEAVEALGRVGGIAQALRRRSSVASTSAHSCSARSLECGSTGRRSSSRSSACRGSARAGSSPSSVRQVVEDDGDHHVALRPLPSVRRRRRVLGARRDRQGAGRDPRERRRDRRLRRSSRERGRRPRPRGGAQMGRVEPRAARRARRRRTSRLRDRRTELFAGWRIFLESLAERRPLVLVIDDLQWADDGLLDFVDGLVDLVEGVPLLVVGCARPELLERRPDWGGGKRNALTVSLGPLSQRQRRRLLVESLLGRDPADAELRAAVVERAAGNPLYAEEFVRMQTAGGDLARPARQRPRDRDGPGRPAAAGREGAASGRGRDGRRRLVGRPAGRVGSGRRDGRRVLLRSLGRKEFLRRERRSAVLGATEHCVRPHARP